MSRDPIDVIDENTHVFIHKTTSELTTRSALLYPLVELKDAMENRGFIYLSPLTNGSRNAEKGTDKRK